MNDVTNEGAMNKGMKYILAVYIFFFPSRICLSMEADDQSTVYWFVDGKHVPIDHHDENGLTLLHKAVLDDNKIDVELLIGAGVQVNVIDDNGISPLWYALFKNNYEIVEILLKAHAEINEPDANGCTPIEFAQSSGNITMIKLLQKYGAHTLCSNDVHGLTILHKAIINKDAKKAIELIKHFPELIEHKTANDASPLSMAVIFKQNEIVKALLEAGADPDKENISGLTAAHMAAFLGSESLLNVLCEYGSGSYTSYGERMDAANWIEIIGSSLYKICCKHELDKKIRLYEIKLFLLKLFIDKHARIRMKQEENYNVSVWNSLVDFGIGDDTDFRKKLTKIFVDFYGGQKQNIVNNLLTVDEWVSYMQTAAKSYCKINIKPLLYYGLLESETADLEVQGPAKTVVEWANFIEQDNFKFLNKILREIARHKSTSDRISCMDIGMLGKKSENILKVLVSHRKNHAITKKKLKKGIREITRQNIPEQIAALLKWKPKNKSMLQSKLDAFGNESYQSLPNLFYVNQMETHEKGLSDEQISHIS